MKRHINKLKVALLLICFATSVILCGCETVKGIGRDIKKVDTWFRENLW